MTISKNDNKRKGEKSRERSLLPNRKRFATAMRERIIKTPPLQNHLETNQNMKSGQAKYRENQQKITMGLFSIHTKMESVQHELFGPTVLVNGTPLESFSSLVLFPFMLRKGYKLGRAGKNNKDLLVRLFKDWFA